MQRVIALGPGSVDRVNDTAHDLKLKYHNKSPVPMSESAHFTQALTDGQATVDLLALPPQNGRQPATDGLRVQILKVQNTGAEPLTIAAAGSNGYPLFHTIPPKSRVHLDCENSLSPIGTDCHLLSLRGAAAENSNWMIVFG